jgi:chromosome segregation ATPase
MTFKKRENSQITLILFIVAILGVTGVVLYQTHIIRSLKEIIQVSEEQRLHVSLGSLEEKLNNKEGTLAVVKKGTAVIKIEMEELKVKLNQTEAMLRDANEQKGTLQQENDNMVHQLAVLKEEVRLWEGQINSLEEEKMVLERREMGLKELKKRIRDFKVKAQKKIDRIKMELGNQGYITKQGKTTFNQKNIVELEKIIITNSSVRQVP